MNYIVFDLEWNQPPNEESVITEPFYLDGEIIEIGAVKLDDHFKTVDDLRLYITPRYYTKMHKRIAALTGIRDKDLLEKGMPFPAAFDRFLEWCGPEFTFMTWSLSDMPMLVDNMLLHGIDTGCLPQCVDGRRIFSQEIMRIDRRMSLNDAMKVLNEKGETAHDALHDSRNTVKICDHLDFELYLGEYTAQVFAMEPVTRSFESLAAIRRDEALRTFTCPWCGETVVCEDWLPLNEDLIAMGVCPQGDEFLMTMAYIKDRPDRYYVKRLAYEMSDDMYEIWQDKKEKALAGV